MAVTFLVQLDPSFLARTLFLLVLGLVATTVRGFGQPIDAAKLHDEGNCGRRPRSYHHAGLLSGQIKKDLRVIAQICVAKSPSLEVSRVSRRPIEIVPKPAFRPLDA